MTPEEQTLLEMLAKKLDGKSYHQIVTNGRAEYKRIVVEYGHRNKTDGTNFPN